MVLYGSVLVSYGGWVGVIVVRMERTYTVSVFISLPQLMGGGPAGRNGAPVPRLVGQAVKNADGLVRTHPHNTEVTSVPEMTDRHRTASLPHVLVRRQYGWVTTCRVWDEITYPFPNFNGYPVEVWEGKGNFIPHLVCIELNRLVKLQSNT